MRCFIHIFVCVCIILADVGTVHAQTGDRAIYDKVHATVSDCLSQPLGDVVLAVAMAMRETPYTASLLEVEPESLQIVLDRTDCMLFVETCTAMALAFKGLEIVQGGKPISAEPSYELFCRNVQNLRYRGGAIDGYPSRLHYTSEWIQQGEMNGVFTELTGRLGKKRDQKFSFMTAHPQSYKQLRNSPENRRQIARIEEELGHHGPYFVISNTGLADPSVMAQIMDGDILAFVSEVDGLDVTHVAIACSVGGQMHFIHASTKSMKVIIEPKTLAEYAKTGVRVIRMN